MNNNEIYPALNEKIADLAIPGVQIEFDPEEAEHVGAFAEDALSETDASESAIDGLEEAHA